MIPYCTIWYHIVQYDTSRPLGRLIGSLFI